MDYDHPTISRKHIPEGKHLHRSGTSTIWRSCSVRVSPWGHCVLSTGAGRRSQGAVPLDDGWSIWDDMVLIHQNRSRKNWAEETHWGHGVTKYPIQDICSRPFRWKSEVSAKVDTEEAHRKEVEKEAEDLKQQFFGRNHGAILGHTARMISWDGGDFWYQLAMNNEFNSWG